ncbi:MAG: hypothetical protein IPM98_12310 [Lewinellaceae bacterium]|nr:hypothetical protein [Lewinellaceae bacterium]
MVGPNLNLTLEQSVARMDSALQTIEYIRSPLGLGWDSTESGQGLPWWLVKLAGLLLTGIAVTFGAPFWFDLLRKMLSLRSGGGAEKSPEPQPLPTPAKAPAARPTAVAEASEKPVAAAPVQTEKPLKKPSPPPKKPTPTPPPPKKKPVG